MIEIGTFMREKVLKSLKTVKILSAKYYFDLLEVKLKINISPRIQTSLSGCMTHHFNPSLERQGPVDL